MTAQPVSLMEIVQALEVNATGFFQYLNLDTGKVVMIHEDSLRMAEDGIPDDQEDYLADWKIESIEEAGKILADTDKQMFVELPDSWEIHEYQLMENFCFSLEDDQTRGDLFFALKGRGAFRRFKHFVQQLGIDQDWYDYRRRRLLEIAVRWCEVNDLEYVDDVNVPG